MGSEWRCEVGVDEVRSLTNKYSSCWTRWHAERLEGFVFKRLTVGLVLLVCMLMLQTWHATPVQVTAQGSCYYDKATVISLIYSRCDFYGVSCRLPLFKAMQESQYGCDVRGDYNAAGIPTSIGIYQFFAGWGGACFQGGLGCSGEYYQRQGLAWRWSLFQDVDMGVRLLTSHQRGGPNYCSHWLVCGGVPRSYVQPARPAFKAASIELSAGKLARMGE